MTSDPQAASTSSIREHAAGVVRTLAKAGYEAYWAGGCVRDTIMGRTPKDYDIATRARPDDVLKLFTKTREVGKAFGVVQVHSGDFMFDVATFRRDVGTQDGRHPDHVEFCAAEEDAKRRDFTINGLFYDPMRDQVIDFVGGVDDIRGKLVRSIGSPDERFAEDFLRMLRAVRFASTLQFELDPPAADAIRRLASNITRVSPERIQQELTRILVESPAAGQGVRMLQDTGLLPVILPEISAMIGVEQPPEFHPEGDVFVHTMMMLDAMKERTPELAYSVLFHDVAKPPTFTRGIEPDGRERIRFTGHDTMGAEMTEQIMKRLRFSNELTEAVKFCVGNHMRFIAVPEMRKATLRRLVGAPTFPTELELHRLDCSSSHGDLSNYLLLTQFFEEMKNEPVLPEPWISGSDIMALGIPEGREIGRWKKAAYDAQLEGRFPSREELLPWLEREIRQAKTST